MTVKEFLNSHGQGVEQVDVKLAYPHLLRKRKRDSAA